jgi:hypothetical protein
MRLLATVAFVLLGSSAAFAFQSSANPRARPGGTPLVHPTPPAPAFALTSYTDHTLWSAAVGGATTLIDFESIADGTQITNNLASFGIQSVTGDSIYETPPGPTTQFVTSSHSLPFPMFIVGTLHSETNFISNRLSPGVYGTGTMTFTFAAPTSATGAWVADQSPLGSGFDIELFSGAVSLGLVTLPPQTSPASFVGVISNTPFTSAKFSSADSGDSWGLDDVEFGSLNLGVFCFGDGSGQSCPCGNNSAVGDKVGCLSSIGTGGKLRYSGVPSTTADSVVLIATDMPVSSALFYQGTTQTSGGAGAVFGDGLRCASGSITRLGAHSTPGGMAHYPDGTDSPVHVHGGVSAGDVRTYQTWYRNANPSFCTPLTFNLTNGLQLTWGP